jgi:UDP-glucose 4-epimerase
VAASSASVYGQAEDFPTTEDHHPWGNDTLDGTTKLMLEGLLRAYRAMHGLAGVSLRYFNVYGPRMDTEGAYTEVMVRWMERIADGRAPLIQGDGRQTMDFVYVEDVARATLAALRSDCETGAFNVASGTETSLRALAQGLLDAMGSTLEPEYGPPRQRQRRDAAPGRRGAGAGGARLRGAGAAGRRPAAARGWWQAQARQGSARAPDQASAQASSPGPCSTAHTRAGARASPGPARTQEVSA